MAARMDRRPATGTAWRISLRGERRWTDAREPAGAWVLGSGRSKGRWPRRKRIATSALVRVSSGRRLAGDRHERRPLTASTLELHALRRDAREQASAAATEVTRRVTFGNRWTARGSAFDDHLRMPLKIIINTLAPGIGVPGDCQGRWVTMRCRRGDRTNRSPLVRSMPSATEPDRKPVPRSSRPCTACRP